MERIVEIKGNVAFPITLDPSVWIFDDRKKRLNDFFAAQENEEDELEAYTKAISQQWDKEVIEGNEAPKQNTKKRKFPKEELMTETYGISLHHFLKNCEPNRSATKFIVHSAGGIHTFPIDVAFSFVLCFSDKGKALKEDGPLHVYYGKNADEKITSVKLFEII